MDKKISILLPFEGESKIDLFQKKEVRKVLYEGEWYFVIEDVVRVLTDSTNPKDYLNKLRRRDGELNKGYGQFVHPLYITTTGGRQLINCINIQNTLRLIQSIPSRKAEPFKRWLAKVGFERLQEIQNPDIAIKRATFLYKTKGYDDEWIEARIRNKTSRDVLTSQWDRGGMSRYIGLLTDAISVETFGIKTARHKQIKGLKSQNLRDNMTPIELTLTTLGEQATTEIIKSSNPNSLPQHTFADKLRK